MREIKFRAWFEDEMLSHENLVYKDQETHAMYTIITNEKREGGIVFMQYTGLKDKNGREIYEGDVYSYVLTSEVGQGGKTIAKSEKTIVAPIVFELGAFRHDGEVLDEVIEFDESFTYLGNIYENPELLEVAE